MQKKLITNQAIFKHIKAKMELEICCLNMLNGKTKAELTVENIFKWRADPQWELREGLRKLDSELTGHMKYLKPQAASAIRENYPEDYFSAIEKCFADAPRDLKSEDLTLKNGTLDYTDEYRNSRLAAATLELSDQEAELFQAVISARKAIEKLSTIAGFYLTPDSARWIVFSPDPIDEIGFEVIQGLRLRKKYATN